MTDLRPVIISLLLLFLLGRTSVAETIPTQPVEIGTAPQFLFDRYIIDNHWAVKYKTETVRRVFHQPVKYEQNPLIAGEGGYICVLKDEDSDLFRMWYQTWVPSPVEGQSGRYAIAYAGSQDGISWALPKLALHEWKGSKDNNIVWTGHDGKRGSQVFLLDVPDVDQRGYRFVMLYGGVCPTGRQEDSDSHDHSTRLHEEGDGAFLCHNASQYRNLPSRLEGGCLHGNRLTFFANRCTRTPFRPV